MNQKFYEPQPVKTVELPEVGQHVRVWWAKRLPNAFIQPQVSEGLVKEVDPETDTFILDIGQGVEFWTGWPWVSTIEVVEG